MAVETGQKTRSRMTRTTDVRKEDMVTIETDCTKMPGGQVYVGCCLATVCACQFSPAVTPGGVNNEALISLSFL